MRFLSSIKDSVLKCYEFIKEMDELMISRLRGEDEFDRPKKTEHKRAPRKNNVSVEDLRPQKRDEVS